MTDLTRIDHAFYTVLKKKQQDFIHLMDAVCPAGATEFTRGELKRIANTYGIAWAPAWIVKDQSRVVKRGVYRVPELQAWRNYKADAAKDDAAFEAAAEEMITERLKRIEEARSMFLAKSRASLAAPPRPPEKRVQDAVVQTKCRFKGHAACARSHLRVPSPPPAPQAAVLWCTGTEP